MKRRDSQDLKNALQALQVNKPLKLSQKPHFKAPDLECAQKEAPQVEVPPLALSQNELPQYEAPLIGVIQTQVPQNEKPQDESPHQETTEFECAQNEQTRIEPPLPEAPQRRDVMERGPSTASGFFKLSHTVFADPVLQKLSGDSFRLFLWLSSRAWRYPTSDGSVRASVRFIEDCTGMSHATVSRGLKTLKEEGLISLLVTDFKQGNLWQICAVAHGGKGPDSLPPQDKRPQNEIAQKAQQPFSKRGGSSLKMSGELPQKESNIRSIKKEKNIKKCGTAIAIEHPFAKEPAAIDPGLREDALFAFDNELPEERQSELLVHFVATEFPHGFLPPTKVIRSMAALSWFATQTSGDLQRSTG